MRSSKKKFFKWAGFGLLYILLLLPHCNKSDNLSPQDRNIFDLVSPSVVKIQSTDLTAGGTGFQIRWGNVNYILTNRHVCAFANDKHEVLVIHPGHFAITLKALAYSKRADLCLLEPFPELPPLSLANLSAIHYEKLWVVGHPYMHELTETSGIKLECGDNLEDLESPYCHTTAEIHPGSSGSPIVNGEGFVEGVIFAGNMSTGAGYYVPLRDVRNFLDASQYR